MKGTATALGACEVIDREGSPVRLAELWRDRPIVLTFVRHFGCIFCREQVADLGRRLRQIRELGAELVIVGNGEPRYLEEFIRTTELDCAVYTDPGRDAFRAAQLKRSILSTITVRTWKNTYRAWRAGSRQGKTQGDRWQQGGVFVISPPGRTTFMYASTMAGDHPDPDDIMSALRGSVAAHSK